MKTNTAKELDKANQEIGVPRRKRRTQARCLCYCRQDWRVAKKIQVRSQSSGGTSPAGKVPVLHQFFRQLCPAA